MFPRVDSLFLSSPSFPPNSSFLLSRHFLFPSIDQFPCAHPLFSPISILRILSLTHAHKHEHLRAGTGLLDSLACRLSQGFSRETHYGLLGDPYSYTSGTLFPAM